MLHIELLTQKIEFIQHLHCNLFFLTLQYSMDFLPVIPCFFQKNAILFFDQW